DVLQRQSGAVPGLCIALVSNWKLDDLPVTANSGDGVGLVIVQNQRGLQWLAARVEVREQLLLFGFVETDMNLNRNAAFVHRAVLALLPEFYLFGGQLAVAASPGWVVKRVLHARVRAVLQNHV